VLRLEGTLQTYMAPVVRAEDPAGIETQLAALKAPLPADHSDFALVKRIAAFVIEDMKARLGSHFMPHHTQMLTVLVRMCVLLSPPSRRVGRFEPRFRHV
jgi:hypothetical protein